jgi:multiple sugar transport system substrate-binding protein
MPAVEHPMARRAGPTGTRRLPRRRLATAVLAALFTTGCGPARDEEVLVLSASAVGAEGEALARQLRRFAALHPRPRVELQRTPDDATQRHQLYVQWLNARVGRPDVLQLDVIWTPEFAAAGWLLPLDGLAPPRADFFAASRAANTWRGRLYAVPWFLDVGVLYWRTDLFRAPPASLGALAEAARRATDQPGGPAYGVLWQGARYEGLVTVFLEVLGGFGGRILGPGHRVEVDSPQAAAALSYLRDQLHRSRIAPREVLTWHEEETRLAFQAGRAAFMRNWPYARTLLAAPGSQVAGRFAVAPVPGGPGGRPTAALGGGQLAINAHSAAPAAAWRLVAFLTAPEQMLERAVVAGQYPARRSLYADPRLAAALGASGGELLALVDGATPRPPTPVWAELSAVLQVYLHRALSGQLEPRPALARAAAAMRQVVARAGLGRETFADDDSR